MQKISISDNASISQNVYLRLSREEKTEMIDEYYVFMTSKYDSGFYFLFIYLFIYFCR